MNVTFQLPCLRHLYRDKPDHYLSHLIGHEGPGSLLSCLKKRGWATEIMAGIDDDGYSANTCCYLFSVSIQLTEAGLHAGPGYGLAPVALLMQYLKLLRETGGGCGGRGTQGASEQTWKIADWCCPCCHWCWFRSSCSSPCTMNLPASWLISWLAPTAPLLPSSCLDFLL